MKQLPLVLLFLLMMIGPVRAVASSALPRSTPEAEGVDSANITALVAALDSQVHAVHSLMLVRHGKVVAEGWWAPYAAPDVHVMYSATKSVTSTAIGFAVQEGRLNVNDLVLAHFPEFTPANPSANMKKMRIRDLLTMSTGHQNETNEKMRARPNGDWTRSFLESEVEHKPGTHFRYNSGANYMLAALVQKVTGQTVEDYLQPRLFAPLGIALHPGGKSPEGVIYGDGDLSLTTEDFAKFGQLYLQKGRWQGHQLLSAPWIETATSRQVSTGSDPDDNWDAGYGFQFWRNKTTGYRADGAFGQLCFVLPEQDVVLAITSGTSDMKTVMNLVWEHLLPAIHAAALPANPVAQEKLSHQLSALSLPVPTGAAHSAKATEITGKPYVFGENEMGLKSVALDFSTGNPVLTFQDADGTHRIVCGRGEWVRGRTGFQKRISFLFDNPNQGIAASGAWSDDDTFVAQLCFNETPYTITARCHFAGAQLFLDLEHNLRWGPTKRPQLVGKRVD